MIRNPLLTLTLSARRETEKSGRALYNRGYQSW